VLARDINDNCKGFGELLRTLTLYETGVSRNHQVLAPIDVQENSAGTEAVSVIIVAIGSKREKSDPE